MLDATLQLVVEELCNDGCQQVNIYIAQIEAGQFPQAMRTLNSGQRQAVLSELKSIMAVYERCELKGNPTS